MYLGSKFICVESKNRLNENDDINDFSVGFPSKMFNINFDKTFLKLTVDELNINYCWYNIIDGKNNKISYFNGTVDTELLIPEGNYNVYELMDYLNSILDGIYTITYYQNQNKYYFKADDPLYSLTCFTADVFLGLKNGTEYVGDFNSIKPVSMTYYQSLYLHSDVSRVNDRVDNITKQTFSQSTIIAKIPIDAPFFSNIYYKNLGNTGEGLVLCLDNFDAMRFWITSETGEKLNITQNYSFTLKLENYIKPF